MTKNKSAHITLNEILIRHLALRSLLICFAFMILSIYMTEMAAKDKSSMYRQGTYITASLAADGTTTNNITCGDSGIGGTVCSGGVKANAVAIYRVKVDDGIWFLETDRQVKDSMDRRLFNDEPLHFKKEKENPLDLLKNGDKVLFRVERHKKIGGTDINIFIPFADKPDKEAKFFGTFVPSLTPTQPARPSDNVRAMCDAHKLSPELEKQFCNSSDAPSDGTKR